MADTLLPLLDALPGHVQERLLQVAEPVTFPAGVRIFREGRRADRFWIIRSGSVRVVLGVPAQVPVTVEMLHRGDLLGWSWLFPPYVWQFGAQTQGSVAAWEFDAAVVREMCEADPVLGHALVRQVARIIGHRLARARMRLVHLYGPDGAALASEGS